jgi:hypothetical protein
MRPEHSPTDTANHPHLDPRSISSRIMNITGYRPDNATLIAMVLNEAPAFTADEISSLISGLDEIFSQKIAANAEGGTHGNQPLP